ncbi:hypothetical protein V9T40_005293 [Parthenolecanium corni]|uniref:N-acetyl-D-glucosamine kinase n=1 Tax=Parthenolecanium corni TaxID=536013 RepID=A0AAN9TDW6_9HEMI
MPNRILGGIEGGGTNTVACLMNTKGEVLVEITGSSTNPWYTGFEKCCELINDLINEAKKKVDLPLDVPLISLGLCLSGVEEEDTRQKIRNTMLLNYPKLSDNYYIHSDTRAPLAMVNDKGGVVLISGTGSNCLLVNPDESEKQCGGFGERLGDEGGAYFIAQRGIKICLDNYAQLELTPNGYSDVKLWEAIKSYFKVEDAFHLIPIFYNDFNKTQIAGLCKSISVLAKNGDPLSKWLFGFAGKWLAKHVQAAYNSAHESLRNGSCGLQVVCVGSVWLSWDLLRPGFEEQLKDTSLCHVKKLSLVKTTRNSSVGAAYLAAHLIHLDLPYSYSENYEVFYEYCG